MPIFNSSDSFTKEKYNNASMDVDYETINDLIKLIILSNERTQDLEIYKLISIIGLDKFIEVSKFFSGKTIKIPKIKNTNSILISALSWYMYKVQNKDISEIKDFINDKLETLIRNSKIKFSIIEIDAKIKELSDFSENRKKAVNKDGKTYEK